MGFKRRIVFLKKRGHRDIKSEITVNEYERRFVIAVLTYKTKQSMKAIDLIFRETLTKGQFEMKSHVLVFIDEAGNEYRDTLFSEVRRNGRFETYHNGMGCEHMQNLMEAIFLNKVNK